MERGLNQDYIDFKRTSIMENPIADLTEKKVPSRAGPYTSSLVLGQYSRLSRKGYYMALTKSWPGGHLVPKLITFVRFD